MTKHEIMTLEEVAEYLRISERTVYDWAQKGEIPCGKFGTSWRFRRKDIEAWVDYKLSPKTEIEDEKITIGSALSEDKIIITDSENKTEVIDQLLELVSSDPKVKNKTIVREEMYKREQLMSTGIGQGVAIPHIRTPEVKDLLLAVAVCKNGVKNYEGLDSEPVKLVFMILARDDQHSSHLKTLSAISLAIKESELKNSLISAETAKEFIELINKSGK